MAHVRCMLDKQSYMRASTCTILRASAPTQTQAHTRARARNHARKHPRAGTQTEKFIIIIAFPRQKWLHECALVLCFA